VYVDTSALGRVLLGEPDADAVLGALETYDEHVASRLLGVELRRLALRFELTDQANALLTGLALTPLDEGLLEEAESLAPAAVATLDAIHLAAAIRLAVAGFIDAVMTYDARLAEGARHHGLAVVSPT
jgi:predicted nucleic acid-binding protein